MKNVAQDVLNAEREACAAVFDITFLKAATVCRLWRWQQQ
jgi:hypothetical protein